jgi:hypothetical protein
MVDRRSCECMEVAFWRDKTRLLQVGACILGHACAVCPVALTGVAAYGSPLLTPTAAMARCR